MGLISYVFPVFLLVGIFFAVSNRGNRVATVKLVAMILFDLFLCMLIELLTKGSAVDGAAAAYSYSFEPVSYTHLNVRSGIALRESRIGKRLRAGAHFYTGGKPRHVTDAASGGGNHGIFLQKGGGAAAFGGNELGGHDRVRTGDRCV